MTDHFILLAIPPLKWEYILILYVAAAKETDATQPGIYSFLFKFWNIEYNHITMCVYLSYVQGCIYVI